MVLSLESMVRKCKDSGRTPYHHHSNRFVFPFTEAFLSSQGIIKKDTSAEEQRCGKRVGVLNVVMWKVEVTAGTGVNGARAWNFLQSMPVIPVILSPRIDDHYERGNVTSQRRHHRCQAILQYTATVPVLPSIIPSLDNFSSTLVFYYIAKF